MFLNVVHIIFFSYCIIVAVLIFYYVYFFSKLAFYEPTHNKNQSVVPLSIIVCAKNEEKNIQRNIAVLLKQQLSSEAEVIVVNDRSVDDTKLIVEQEAAQNKYLKLINLGKEVDSKVGKKYPLSIGISEAKNDILLLTDADCVPSSYHWAEKMQNAYTQNIEIILGYGAYEKLPGLLNKIIRFETFHSAIQYLSYALVGLPYMGVGRNLSYKKELFIKNKGFEKIDHIPGGDDDLFINAVANAGNTAIVVDKEAHTISVPKRNWLEWRRQKSRHYTTSKYYKPIHQFLLGVYSVAQFLFYPLLVTAFIIFNWQMVLLLFIIKSFIQYVIFARAMKTLNEADLIKWILVMDLWMFLYYILFAPSLFIRQPKKW